MQASNRDMIKVLFISFLLIFSKGYAFQNDSLINQLEEVVLDGRLGQTISKQSKTVEVISAVDLQRSGYTNVVEALQQVAGLDIRRRGDLIDEEICFGNPVPLAKRDCKHLIKDSQVKNISRLTEHQWQYLLDTAVAMADDDALYERHLFIIATMKTLFLRLSELSERKDWTPLMSHFWLDDSNNWWFKAYGKGKKIRDITVPQSYLPFLSRYREWRGLSPLPSRGAQTLLVEKIRGRGGLTGRHIARLIQEIFDAAFTRMKAEQGLNAAQKLQEASTHYLRHTGASMEIERNRPLKDLSEDLGHASSATTDTVYVQVERKKRASSGKDRKVE